METSSTKAEPTKPPIADPAPATSGVVRKVRAGLFALLVLGALVWGFFWQKPPIIGPQVPGLAASFLSLLPNPTISSAPVMRGGHDGGFIPRGLCSPAGNGDPATVCEVFPDGRLFLPRTNRGPLFARQIIRDPATGRAAALSLYGAVFRPVEDEGGVQWVETVPGLRGRSIDETPEFRLTSDGSVVTSVAFSPDGSRIVSGGGDGSLRLWDANTGAALGEPLRGHEDGVSSVAFSPDGSRIVSGGGDGSLRLWDSNTGAALDEPLRGHEDGVLSVAFSPDGSRIVSGGWDGTVRLWNADTGAAVGEPLRGHEGWVLSVAFSPDGSRIVSGGSYDRTVRLWDADTGGALGEPLRGREGDVISVAFSPDGSRIISGSDDGTLSLWDAATGATMDEPLRGHQGLVHSVAFSPDGSRIVSGSVDVAIWSILGEIHPLGAVRAIAFHGADEVLGVGDQGFLATSVPEAEGWQQSSPEDLRSLGFLAVSSVERTAIAVGSIRQVFARITGSDSWSDADIGPIPGEDPVSLHSVHVVDQDRAWVAGAEGTVFFTADGTTTWTRQHALPGLTIDALHVAEYGTGWASGLADGRVVWLHANDATQGNWRQLHPLPAPWWFALLILGTPLALRANARAWVDTGPRVEQSIADRAVNDLPLDWSGVDALGLKSIARSLSRFLRNTDTKPPLTIAVTGRWGSGKSSLMNLLHLDLQRRGANTVWFNAWHHRSEDHLFAALMEAIRTEGVPSAWSARGFGFRLRLLRHRNRQFVAGASILATVAAMALGFFLAGTWLLGLNLTEQIEIFAELELLIPDFEGLRNWLGRLPSPPDQLFGPILGFFAAGVALWLWVKATLPFPVKPAALLTEFASRTSVTGFSDRLGFRHLFGRALGEVATVLRRPTSAGLVIFIDDLDRCHPEHVLNVLEAVNFVVNAGPCIVVLGMDRQQVEHAVGLAFAKMAEGLPEAELGLSEIDDDADEEPKARENRRNALKRAAYARRYMEKLVNLEVVIPTMQRTAVGLMVSGPQPGSDAQQTAAVHDPGKLHRRLLPFWNGLGWVLPRAGLAFLAAAALVFVTVSDPTRVITESAMPSLSPTGPASGPGLLAPDPGETDPEAEPVADPLEPAPPSTRGEPIPLQLAADPEAQPVPAWGIWLTAFVAMALLLLLVLSRLMASRATIRRDSPEFRRALAIVEPLLARAGVTPRDIRRWENRMRFLAERQRVDLQKTDSLEMVLERMGRLLGIALVTSRKAQDEAVVPEPTLIALGAIEFSFPDLIGGENDKPFSERLSGLEREGGNQIIQRSRVAFELEFTEQPLNYWPDDRAAAKYQQTRNGA